MRTALHSTGRILLASVALGLALGLLRYDDGCLKFEHRFLVASLTALLSLSAANCFHLFVMRADSRLNSEPDAGGRRIRPRDAIFLAAAAIGVGGLAVGISIILVKPLVAPEPLRIADYVYVFFLPAAFAFALSVYFIRLRHSMRSLRAAVFQFQAHESPNRNSRSAPPGANATLVVREAGRELALSFEEILYIASQGKRSSVHTIRRDYETSRLLKELLANAPDYIVRVHKSFAANMNFVRDVRHSFGGNYELLLIDEDDTTLPVGRSYLRDLRAMRATARGQKNTDRSARKDSEATSPSQTSPG